MRNQSKSTERVATAIVGGLNAMVLRVDCASEGDAICYSVRSRMLKLRAIMLDCNALERLLTGADGAVKIEYRRHELRRTAAHRVEYRCPRARRQLRRAS